MEKVMFRINGSDFQIKEILNKIDPTFPFQADGDWLDLKIFCGMDNGEFKILRCLAGPRGRVGDSDFVIRGMDSDPLLRARI